MAEAAESLKSTFNSVSLKGILSFTFKAVVFGLIIGGICDFTLFHNHPIGKAILAKVNEPMLSFYDGVANFFGFPEYARATDFLDAAGACTGGLTTEGIPIPC